MRSQKGSNFLIKISLVFKVLTFYWSSPKLFVCSPTAPVKVLLNTIHFLPLFLHFSWFSMEKRGGCWFLLMNYLHDIQSCQIWLTMNANLLVYIILIMPNGINTLRLWNAILGNWQFEVPCGISAIALPVQLKGNEILGQGVHIYIFKELKNNNQHLSMHYKHMFSKWCK